MNKKISFRNGNAPDRFWNIVTNDKESSAEISLYGDVVSRKPIDYLGEEAQYICPEDFSKDLEALKDKQNITIKINSLGGDVYTAIAIHNAIKGLNGIKTVIIDGIAASAASVIAMAGDKIKVYSGSLMMIHNVSGLLFDWFTIADLKKVIRGFDANERAIASIYDSKTKLGVNTIRSMMDKETWMTGDEAVANGFADELVEGNMPSFEFNANNKLLMVNGVQHNTEGLTLPKLPCIKTVALATETAAQDKPFEGVKPMKTVEDLRKEYPELVAQIEAEAVNADRERIKEIEEIQDTIADPELIASAKFIKPTNAATLALEAMKRAKAAGLDYLKARTQEQEAASKVTAAASIHEDATAIDEANKASEAAKIKNAAELFMQVYN